MRERIRRHRAALRCAPSSFVHGTERLRSGADGAFVIDAIDAPRARRRSCMAVHRRQSIAVCGAAGGRTDPLRLRRDDLARTTGDALLASVRSRLRREHGFPGANGGVFGVGAVYSEESRKPTHGSSAGAPLSCAGYGSSVAVTATMGFASAAWAIEKILGR